MQTPTVTTEPTAVFDGEVFTITDNMGDELRIDWQAGRFGAITSGPVKVPLFTRDEALALAHWLIARATGQ